MADVVVQVPAQARGTGNLLRFGALTADQIINTGNTVSFAPAELTLQFDQR